MKLLAIGGSSFVGKNLISKSPKEWDIHATYHKDATFPEFAKKFRNVNPIELDLTKEESVDKLAKIVPNPDVIIYFAANSDPHKSVELPALDLKLNALGVVLVLERVKCKRFVYISSGAVYLKASLPYVFSKRIAEQYVKFFAEKKRFNYVIIRLFETFGPYIPQRKIFRKLVEQFDMGDPNFTIYSDGKNLIDKLYIEDTVSALLKVISSDKTATVDLCSGHPISIRELVERVAKVYNITPKISHKGDAVENVFFAGDPKPMQKIFGFKVSISFEDGLKKWREFKEKNGKY
jgi:UDP-glucose 4-epimerase